MRQVWREAWKDTRNTYRILKISVAENKTGNKIKILKGTLKG
jgi:hypothetical protein